jgi:hypothetical protein
MIRRISSQANHGPSFYIQSLYEFCTYKILDYGSNIERSTELKRIVINTFLLILEPLNGSFEPTNEPQKLLLLLLKC